MFVGFRGGMVGDSVKVSIAKRHRMSVRLKLEPAQKVLLKALLKDNETRKILDKIASVGYKLHHDMDNGKFGFCDD